MEWEDYQLSVFYSAKKRPVSEALLFHRNRFSLFRGTHSATTSLTGENSPNSSNSHEDIDDPFYGWPAAEQHIDDIEFTAHETSDPHETPVETANDEEDAHEHATSAAFSFFHRRV